MTPILNPPNLHSTPPLEPSVAVGNAYPGPALIAFAALPQRLTPNDRESSSNPPFATNPQRHDPTPQDHAGAPRIAVTAMVTLLLLRLPAWIAPRSGLAGLGLRVVLLAAAFDAWAGPRTVDAIADDLDDGDLPQARRHLQSLTREAIRPGARTADDMSAQEIADRTTQVLANSAADNVVGPWLAYALFDLPGAIAYHLPVLLTILWGEIPAALLRLPLIGRAAGAGPRFAILRGIAARAAGFAYGAASPAIGADPRPAITASLHADDPAAAAASTATQSITQPARSVRSAVRLHRVALAIAGGATVLTIVALGRRTHPAASADREPV